ncbi:MAG: hypothetical protein ACRCYU_05900 [Nocardioides sp.]
MTDPISRRTYQPGSWFGIFGDSATVLLPPSEKSRVAALWSLIDDGAGFDEVLDALISTGLRDLPGFVLVSELDGATQVVIRGAARAEFDTAQGPVEIAGSSATTWVEHTLSEVTRISVVVEEAGAPADSLTIGPGLVRLARMDAPPRAGVPDAAGSLDSAASVESMAAQAGGPSDLDGEAELVADDPDSAAAAELGTWDSAGNSAAADHQPEPEVKVDDGFDSPAEADALVREPESATSWLTRPVDRTAPDITDNDPLGETNLAAIAAGAAALGATMGQESAADESARELGVTEVAAPAALEPSSAGQDSAGLGAAEFEMQSTDAAADDPAAVDPAAVDPAGPPADEDHRQDGTSGLDFGEVDAEHVGFDVPNTEVDPADVEVDLGAGFADEVVLSPAIETGSGDESLADEVIAEARTIDQPLEPELAGREFDPLGGGFDSPAWRAPAAGFAPAEVMELEDAEQSDPFAIKRAGTAVSSTNPPVFGEPGSSVARISLSTGEELEVFGPIVIGRAPNPARVEPASSGSGGPTLLAVPSPSNEISSTHLDIRPGTGIDLGLAVATDLNSTNGSIVMHPGLGPRTLRPGIAEPLFPGTVIDLGDGLTINVESPQE